MAKKHDPFFIHLWDELTSAEILQRPDVQKWLDVPAQVQSQFIEAAKRAMNAALGVAQPKRKAAKKKAPKAKAKAKPKAKAKKKAAAKKK
ncbi:hypothetical protein [Dongia sp.]|uniref:hypothetical protein n=1 Tax=Dongia sp. TaxID=1977262 RepID=UPI0037513EC9